MEDLPDFHFMFFDRYEIHIQAFANVFYGQFIIFNPHLHKIIFEICDHIFTKKTEQNKIEQKSKTVGYLGHTFSGKLPIFWSPIMTQIIFSRMIP